MAVKLSGAQQELLHLFSNRAIQKTVVLARPTVIEERSARRGKSTFRMFGVDHRTLDKLIALGLLAVDTANATEWKTRINPDGTKMWWRRVVIVCKDSNAIMTNRVRQKREELKEDALTFLNQKLQKTSVKGYTTYHELIKCGEEVCAAFRVQLVDPSFEVVARNYGWRYPTDVPLIGTIPPRAMPISLKAIWDKFFRLGYLYQRYVWLARQRDLRLLTAQAAYVEPPEEEVRALVIADLIEGENTNA